MSNIGKLPFGTGQPMNFARANGIEAASKGALRSWGSAHHARAREDETSPGAYIFENYIVDFTLESERHSEVLSFAPYFSWESDGGARATFLASDSTASAADTQTRQSENVEMSFAPSNSAPGIVPVQDGGRTKLPTRTIEVDMTMLSDRAVLGQSRQPSGTVEIALKGPAGITVSRSTMVREFDVSKLLAEAERRTQEEPVDIVSQIIAAPVIVPPAVRGWHEIDESIHSMFAEVAQDPSQSLSAQVESEAVEYFYGKAEGQTYTAELRFRAKFSEDSDEQASETGQSWDVAESGTGAQSFAPPSFQLQEQPSSSSSFSMLDVIDEGYRVLPSKPQSFASQRQPDVEVGESQSRRLSAPKKGLGAGLNFGGKSGGKTSNPWRKV